MQKQEEMRTRNPFSVAVKGWLLVMIPIVVQAGHHPGHGAMESVGGEPRSGFFLEFVGIMALLKRKRK